MIEQLNRFQGFTDRDLGAGVHALDAHRRMLALFDPMRSSSGGDDLNADQIIALMEARLHPESKARKAASGGGKA